MTALTVVEGALVIAWGSRLEAQRWNGQRLETTAFHEAAVLVTSLSAIKRFIVAGDLHKGIAFLQLAPDGRAFNGLSKDFDNCDVLATEFLINGPKLFVLAGDAAANLRLFTYQPDHPLSWAGRRMLPVWVPIQLLNMAQYRHRHTLESQYCAAGARCTAATTSAASCRPSWRRRA